MDKVIFGDCRETMRALIDQGVKVQTCITSPPYWQLRDYGVEGQIGLEQTLDEHIAVMVDVFELVRQLLSDDGTLWLNIGDLYAQSGRSGLNVGFEERAKEYRGGGMKAERAYNREPKRVPKGLKRKDLVGLPWRVAFALQAAGWYLRQDIIWHKPNPMPESAKDRCTKAHEYLFLLSKSKKYYYDADAIKEPVAGTAHSRGKGINPKSGVGFGYAEPDPKPRTKKKVSGWAEGPGNHSVLEHAAPSTKDSTKYNGKHTPNRPPRSKQNESFAAAVKDTIEIRNKRSVWSIHTEPFKEAHFATFPRKLVEPCILAGSRPGDLVFDPFMGSGTVAQVAQQLGRHWLGCELNEQYQQMQDNRTRQRGLIL